MSDLSRLRELDPDLAAWWVVYRHRAWRKVGLDRVVSFKDLDIIGVSLDKVAEQLGELGQKFTAIGKSADVVRAGMVDFSVSVDERDLGG